MRQSPYGRDATVCIFCTKVLQFLKVPKRASSKNSALPVLGAKRRAAGSVVPPLGGMPPEGGTTSAPFTTLAPKTGRAKNSANRCAALTPLPTPSVRPVSSHCSESGDKIKRTGTPNRNKSASNSPPLPLSPGTMSGTIYSRSWSRASGTITRISPSSHLLTRCRRNVIVPPLIVFLIATAQFMVHGSMKRRPFLLLSATALLAGCSSWSLFSPSKSKEPGDASEDRPHTVGDLALPFGMFPVKIEAVGLVSGLQGKGSDPEPSQYRGMLMAEMQRRGVENPNQLLATHNYSLVIVRGFLRPGVQKGDHFDVELRVKDRSETTSLRGGYLLETRLSDSAIIYGKLLDGKVRGIAQGPVLVDPSATEKHNSVQLGRGVVLGGGVALESRSVGLTLMVANKPT